jgi:probable O-glycosylation ligase (exosortase A-associated)
MSKTAIVWLLLYGTGAITSFVNPAYGLYAYFLDYYGHPSLRWWGKGLPDLRWSFTIALVTLVAFILNQNKPSTEKSESHPQTKWLIMFILTALLVTPTVAVDKVKSFENTLELAKLAILYFLIINTIRTKEHFHYLILIQILGIFWWGWDAFEDPKRRDGRLESIGGPDSFSSNGAAAHLLAIMPFIGVVFLTGKPWERALCLLAAPFVINAFVLCSSRGALLGLVVAGLCALFLTKGRFRRNILVGMTLGGILLYSMMDPQFIERQSTIQDYAEDEAATSRMELWQGGLKLIKDYPLGTGGGGFNRLSPIYAPGVVEAYGNERSIHNTYLQGAAEWGIAGLIFYLGFLISTLREIRRVLRESPTTLEEQRLHAKALGIALGLIGILTAGMFSSALYSEVIYWFAAFTSVLKNLYLNERKETANR